jgi:hypothetical protein
MADKAIEKGRTERYLPKAAWDRLSEKERVATDEKKKAASRKGKQFVSNTPAAKKAGKAARAAKKYKQK